MESQLWDVLREAGIKGYLVLACMKDEERDELVGPGLREIAQKEASIGKVLLDQKMAGIRRDGLPEPPPPESSIKMAAEPIALKIGRKPFQLPKKTPEVMERVVTKEVTHIDKKAKVTKANKENECTLEAFWAYFLHLGVHSFLWTDRFENENFRAQAKEVMMEDWTRCKNLKNNLKCLEAWIQHCTNMGMDWRTPDSITVRAFLNKFRSDGPFVPKRYFDALRWVHSNLGLNSTTDLERVRRTVDAPASHVPTQANPLKMTVITIISNAMNCNNIFVAALAVFWNLLVCSVLRPKHLQRSSIEFEGDIIVGHANKGKRRVRGHQVPFDWACPRFDAANNDLSYYLRQSLSRTNCGNSDRMFVLPDFAPARADWSTAVGFTDQPMDPKKITRMMGLFLKSYGVPQEELDLISGLYSGRRVQPTVADLSQESPEFRVDIGGWTDQAAKSRVAMPNLYSAGRLYTQAERKRKMLLTANLAYGKFVRDEIDIYSELGTVVYPEWKILFKYWPSKKEVRDMMNCKPSFSNSSSAKLVVSTEKDEIIDNSAPALKKRNGDENSDLDSSGSGSGSVSEDDIFSSDQDDDKNAEDEVYPNGVATMKWQMASGAHGRLHLLEAGECVCVGARSAAPSMVVA